MRLMLPRTDSDRVQFTVLDIKRMTRCIAEYLFALETERKIPPPLLLRKVEDNLQSLHESAKTRMKWRIQAQEGGAWMEDYDFDAFYMDVIDHLLDLSQAKVAFSPNTNPEDTREWKELDKVRETLEYIEDRELYSAGIKYKADVMEFVTSRVGTVNFANLVAFFKTNRSRILNVIYQKDRSLAAPKREAV